VSKVTSKLQVTIPKAIAQELGIKPGVELNWILAGSAVRVVPADQEARSGSVELRRKHFDEATNRQKRREKLARRRKGAKDRGWRREDLYLRGRSR